MKNGLNDFLLKMQLKILGKESGGSFRVPIKVQKKYLNHFLKPKDEIERSYFQYCCQMKLKGRRKAAVLNILSLPGIFVYVIKCYKKEKQESVRCNFDAVLFWEDSNAILPDSLKNECLNIKQLQINPPDIMQLLPYDMKYIFTIVKRYPLSWHFILKNIIKLAKYSGTISKYNPKAVIVSAEYSFTSSVLTDYCNQRRVQHINIMHGNKMFNIRDSFFKFNRCYVWEKYFSDIMVGMKADKNQFIIERPQFLSFDPRIRNSIEVNFTYYLQIQSKKELEKLKKELLILADRGRRVAVRPHPSYTNRSWLKKVFANSMIEIEDLSKVSIDESIMRTECVISQHSTVLYQAIQNNVKIAIDDVTNPTLYKELKESLFICMYKPHMLLSVLVEV